MEFPANDNANEPRFNVVPFPQNLEIASLRSAADAEIAEPAYTQHIHNFPEAETSEEMSYVREKTSHLIEQTLDRYGDYVDDDHAQDSFLRMNHLASNNAGYYMGVWPGQIEFTDHASSTMYRYYVDDDHVVRRHDYSLSTFIGLPRPGEVTTDTYLQIKDERLRQENKNHEFTQFMGFADKTVGAAEMSHIAELVQLAEPIAVSLTTLDIYYRRKMGAAPPTEEATQKAATDFRRDVANYLEKHERQTSVTTEIVNEKGQHASMSVGHTDRGGQTEPYVNLIYNTTISDGGKYYVRWHYYVAHDHFLGERLSWYENKSGEKRPGSLFLQTLDRLEQAAIRNFSRKPAI
jgi:hypothetical protein